MAIASLIVRSAGAAVAPLETNGKVAAAPATPFKNVRLPVCFEFISPFSGRIVAGFG